MYLSMPYSSGHKLSWQRKATVWLPIHKFFVTRAVDFWWFKCLKDIDFCPGNYQYCVKLSDFFIPGMSHTFNMHLFDVQCITTSIGTSTSQQQARFYSVIPLSSVGLFISNFWHFVHSELFMFLVQKVYFHPCSRYLGLGLVWSFISQV